MTRLFHVSDVHFGCEDPEALDWFAACVAEEKADAVALTGDLTMRARQREFDAACAWILGIDAPVTVEVGNHDLPYFNPFARFFRPYARFRSIASVIEKELDLPGTSLVSLKTTARAQWRFDWSKGIVTDKALARTLDAIGKLPQDRTVLVCAHHPLVEANTKGQALTTNGEKALAALAGAGVDAVLTGHVHDAFDLRKETAGGPIRMIGAGTLSKRLRSTPPSFNILTIEDGAIDVEVRNADHLATPEMQIDDVPPDAEPPGQGDPVAPAAPHAEAERKMPREEVG